MNKNICKIVQPTELKVVLYPYQLAMVYKMEKLEQEQTIENNGDIKETRLGINADPIGTGKTYEMITLIIRDKMQWDIETPFINETILYEAGGIVKNRLIKRYNRINTTLILASSIVIGQWVDMLANTKLRVITITNKNEIDQCDPNLYDIILVTPQTYNIMITSHIKIIWKRFIFDDPGHNKVTGMKNIQAGFYWFVTATPNAITSYHYNCKDSMMKNIIGDGLWNFDVQFSGMILKNDPEFIILSVKLPPIQYHTYICSGGNSIDSLYGTVEEVIDILGCAKTTNIIELVRKRKLEELRINPQRQISIHTQISELQNRYAGNCQICMTTMTHPILEPNCHTLFCTTCLLNWLHIKNACPICRVPIQLDELVYVNDTTDSEKKIFLSKSQQIIEIIKSKPNGKFLVFSDDFETKMNQVTKNIASYKSGKHRVLIVNLKLNIAGINFPDTTDIILSCKDMGTHLGLGTYLGLGRAQCIGRLESLNVHQLKGSFT